MCVPVNEQETVITFSRDSNEATIYTSDTTVMTKLDNLCDSSDEWELTGTDRAKLTGDVLAKNYRVKNKSLVSFRTRKTKREMTDEQREAAAERLRKARGKKNEEVQN